MKDIIFNFAIKGSTLDSIIFYGSITLAVVVGIFAGLCLVTKLILDIFR